MNRKGKKVIIHDGEGHHIIQDTYGHQHIESKDMLRRIHNRIVDMYDEGTISESEANDVLIVLYEVGVKCENETT